LKSVRNIKREIETTVVRPIFDSVGPNGRRDQSLPEVVFDNRRNRAYGRVLDALVSRGAPAIPKELRKRLESMVENWSTQAFDDAFQPIQEFARGSGISWWRSSREILDGCSMSWSRNTGEESLRGSVPSSCEVSSLTIA
jgi:hypothetical protein